MIQVPEVFGFLDMCALKRVIVCLKFSDKDVFTSPIPAHQRFVKIMTPRTDQCAAVD